MVKTNSIYTGLPTTIFETMSRLAREHNAINLGQGFPDTDGPEDVRRAAAEALISQSNQYPPMLGLPELRQAVAGANKRFYGIDVDWQSEVLVTSGATEALSDCMAALLEPGDDVVVFEPLYDCYVPLIRRAGAIPKFVRLTPPEWRVDTAALEAAFSPRTKAVLLNNPLNPAAKVFGDDELATLARLIVEHDAIAICDEVYEHIVFDGLAHQSVLRHAELAARSFVVSSFGKTYHCTGWKVGYCIAPAALSAEFRKVHQYLTFCTFQPAQWAFAEVLERDPQHYLDLPRFYQAKRDRFRALLSASKFKLQPVSGAYFQLVDYSAISDKDDLTFCEWLIREAGVAAIPVSAFYETPPNSRLIRFCFAKNDDTLVAAAERLCLL